VSWTASTNEERRNAAVPEQSTAPADALGLIHDVACRRISSELADFFRQLHKQLWVRFVVITVSVALLSWLGSFLYAVLLRGKGTLEFGGVYGIVAIAVLASAFAIVALSPVLRKSEQYLFQTVSIIARANIELLSLIGRLTELREGDTAGHTLRVTGYTMLFAESLRLPRDTLVRAVKGAMLHDVGKLVMPDCVISKPGPLTQEERVSMQKHVPCGLDIVRESELLSAAINVVAYHHEHYDGSGYPHRLNGNNIPLEARLFAIVDVFDALTSSRVYKSPLTVSEALQVMARERGSHFDPWLFDRFVEAVRELEPTVSREKGDLAAMLLEHMTPYLDYFLLGRIFSQPKTSALKAIWRSLINVDRTALPDEAGDARTKGRL
jgi:putative nucleotidyltransferase with HDIG domain